MSGADHIIFSGTDKRVAAGIRRCVAQVTANHSTTSRRYSLATLLRAELDEPVERVVKHFKGSWSWPLLSDFKMSKVWLHPPVDSKVMLEGLNNYERAQRWAMLWQARLKSALRSAHARGSEPITKECETFCSTLDSLISLIDDFQTLKPTVTHGPTGRITLRSRRHAGEYCELCWRQTERSIHGERRDEHDQRVSWSRRFCTEHNPQKSPANYRRDLKFKERFVAERNLLTWQGVTRHRCPFVFLPDATCASGMAMHLVPVSAHAEDVRRAAYAMVRSGLQGTQAQCLALKSQGCSIGQIAARLAITERAVRQAITTAKPRLESAERIRWGGRSAPL